MYVRFTGWDGETALDFSSDSALLGIREALEFAGLSIASSEFGDPGIEALVAWNHSESAMDEAAAARVPVARRLLILWESPPVWPSQYRRRVYSKYGRILALSPLRASRVRGAPAEGFMHPTKLPKAFRPEFEQFRDREPVLALMQANKFSSVPGERYTLRRKVIDECQRRRVPIAVYGPGWNTGRRSNLRLAVRSSLSTIRAGKVPTPTSFRHLGLRISDYRGWVDDKHLILQNHRIAMIIENCDDYLSEKPIDSVASGTIALYAGPAMTDLLLPADLVLPSRASARDLVDRAEEVLSQPVETQFQIAARQYRALEQVRGMLDSNQAFRVLGERIVELLKAS